MSNRIATTLRRVWFLVALAGLWAGLPWAVSAQEAPSPSGGDWIDLTDDADLAAWKTPHGEWERVASVALRPDNDRFLAAESGGGPVLYNGARGRTPNLNTREWFGDVELHAEFLVPRGSNSGIKFEGLYEIQIADSHGKATATASDCGGIYPRAELLPKYHHIDEGYPPRQNACAEPGQWQTLEAVFYAPRFDETGKKTRSARFERVVLNGKVIHEGQELPCPTGHAWHRAEVPEGPILLQGDHGPVAFRQIRVRRIAGEQQIAAAHQEHGKGADKSLNKSFEDPDLKVDDFVQRFENEDRDIYRNRRAILERVDLKQGDSVADIGAGTGLFTRLFAEKVGGQGTVYAVDIAKPFLDRIAADAEVNGTSQIKTVLGGQDSTNLTPGSIDAAFLCDTYHHFERPEPMLKSIHAALRPGGRLVIVEFDRREGVSTEFILNHIRASQADFKAEIAAMGFEEIVGGDPPPLKENFLAVFRKVERPEAVDREGR